MPNDAGNSLTSATQLTLSSTLLSRPDIAEPNVSDFYRFTLANRSSVSVAIANFSGDVELRVLNEAGTLVTVDGNPLESANPANFAESLNAVLNPGLYYIEVFGESSLAAPTDYTLTASSSSNIASDILWRNYATGENVVWTMDGTTRTAVLPISNVTNLSWQIQGTGDFNKDGRDDIVWRNTATGENVVWTMDGTTRLAVLPIPNVTNLSWQIQGTGDFNKDGNVDLVWRNFTTGENVVWAMNGTTRTAVLPIPNVATVSWRIQGTGDFNKDGNVDLVWRNFTTGENVVWAMNGTTRTAVLPIPNVTNLSWQIQGTGDFNKDGNVDLVWRNFTTGENVVWAMNGTTRTAVLPIPNVTNLNWRAVSPFIRTNAPTPADTAGNSPTSTNAFVVGSDLSGVAQYGGFVDAADPNDYYQFSLGDRSTVILGLAGLAGNLDLQLLSESGTVLQTAAQTGNTAESIRQVLQPGTYYARVFPTAGASSTYNLTFTLNNFPSLATNVALAVDEGAIATISSTVLQVTDNDDAADRLTYTITAAPTSGTLLFDSAPLTGTLTLTQADINSNRLSYRHGGSESLTDSFSFTVADSVGGSITNSFTFTINSINDPPGLQTNAGLTVNEGAPGNLQGRLNVTDNDNDSSELTYSITSAPLNGALSLNSAPLVGGTFTQADIDTGDLLYRHNGSETLSDRFTFTVVDPDGASLTPTTFSIQVTAVNDLPRVGINAGLSLDEGGSGAVSSAVLEVTDNDNGADQLTFTLQDLPTTGALLLDGTELLAGGTFSQDDINQNRITYQHNGDETPIDSFTFVVRDPAGATLAETAFLFNINPVNDAPVLTVPLQSQSVDQNSSTGILGVSITDADSDPGFVTVTLGVESGTLALGAAANLDFFSGNNQQQIVLRGTQTAINDALDTLLYRSNPSFQGTDTVSVTVNDNGNNGSGGEQVVNDSFEIDVRPINQPPVITLPGTPPTVREDQATGVQGISIADPDVGGGIIEVSLIASNGTLSFSSDAGVVFEGPNTGRTLVFSGTLGVVNAALNNLRFLSDPNRSGAAAIAVSVNDNGNTGNGTARSDTQTLSFTITPVNDAPILTLPDVIEVNEGISAGILGVLIGDVDAGSGDLTVELAVSNGLLTFGSTTGLTFTVGDGTADDLLTFSGTLAEINDAIRTLSYLPNANISGFDSLEITVNDNGNTGGSARTTSGSVAIAIGGLNSAPVINLPATLPETQPNTVLSIPTIFITDPDVGAGLVSVSIKVSNGRLTVTPATGIEFQQGTSAQGNRITFTGAIGTVNSTLASLIYRGNPGFVDAFDTLEVSVNDNGNTGTGTALSDFESLRIRVGNAVNQAPTAGVDNFNIGRNGTLNVAAPGVRANDSDPNGDPLTLSLSVNPIGGTVTNFNNNGAFVYTPTAGFFGTDSFIYAVSDGLDTVAGTAFINVTNNAPIAASDSYSFTVATAQTIAVPGVLVNDIDANGDLLTPTLVSTAGAIGTLALNPNGSFVYTPPNSTFSGVETFTYRVNDGLVDSSTASILITVSPTTTGTTNVAPVIGLVNISGSYTENAPAVALDAGIVVSDSNSPTLANATVAIATGYVNGEDLLAVTGTLPASITTNFNAATGSLILTGTNATPANFQTALRQVTYRNTSENPGTTPRILTVTVKDGAATSNTASASRTFSVVAINDAPVAVNDPPTGTVYVTPPSTPLSVTLTNQGVLANDTDVDTPLVSLTATAATTTALGGTIALNANGTFVYTPTATQGVDSFTYTVRDGAGGSATAIATISVTTATINQPPIATDDSQYTTSVGTALSVSLTNLGVLANDTDPNPTNTLTASVASTATAQGGRVTLSPNGTFTYTPAAGINNTVDSFTYTVTDGAGGSDTGVASITIGTVTATNQPPVATDDSQYTTSVGTALSVSLTNLGVLANDIDPNPTNTLTASVASTATAQGGRVTLSPNGTFTYTPAAGINNTVDSFTYTVTDGAGGSDTGVASITIGTVTATNQPPIATDDSQYTTSVGTALSVSLTNLGVLANDTDPNPTNTLTASVASTATAQGGRVTLSPNGTFTYTPAAGINNTVDSFTYTVTDGAGGSDTGVASITIGTVTTTNQAPTAGVDTFRALPSTTLQPFTLTVGNDRDLLTNDTDPEGLPLTASVVTQPGRGTLSNFNATVGTFNYVPNANFTGTDSFTYTVSDGALSSTPPTTVFISVGANTAPTFVNLSVTRSVVAGTSLVVDTNGSLISNATDAEADPLTLEQRSQPTRGTATLNANGTFTYTPNAGTTVGALDSFTYIARDDFAASTATATVFLTVVGNTAPNAGTDPSYGVAVNRTLAIASAALNQLDSNASDPDPGTTLTVTKLTDPTKGTLTAFGTDGTFTYNPAGGTAATIGEVVSFTYAVSDGQLSDTATATISIVASAAPTVINDTYTAVLGQPLTASPSTQTDLLSNDTIAAGATATISVLTQPTQGVFTDDPNADGSFVYTPNPTAVAGAIDTFTYRVNDGVASSNTATVLITISSSQPPSVAGETFTTVGDRPVTFAAPGVLANEATLNPGATLTVFDAQLPSGPGSLSLSPNGAFTYTPLAGGTTGIATFVYRVSNGTTSSLATLTLSLTANSAPTIGALTAYSVNRGNVLTVTNPTLGILRTASDPENDLLTATTVSPTSKGSLTLNPNGTFSYTPNSVQFPTAGTDSFVYRVNDTANNTATQTVTISVATTGGATPVADSDTFTVAANNTLQVAAIGVLEGDTDADADVLAVASPGSLTTSRAGTVTLSANGSFSYQPAANFVGVDSFTYRATDGINTSTPATVTITVGATNNAPVIAAPGSQFGAQLNQAIAVAPIVVSDLDAGTNLIRASLSTQFIPTGANPTPVAVGLINLGGTTGITFTTGANNTGSFVIQGTLAAINAALASVTYTPQREFLPDDVTPIENYPIIIGVNDQGFTGGATVTPQSSNASITVVRSNETQQVVRDINTFPASAGAGNLGSAPQNLTAAGSLLYFTADDGNAGVELWQSDGTENGTTRVTDLNPAGSALSGNADLTVVGNTLYFTANDGIAGRELWQLAVGGTAPTRVTDINPTGGNSNPSDLTVLNGTLFFLATNSAGTTTIYRTNGTTVTPVGTGYTAPSQLTVVGNVLYFTANGDGELWRTDGTTATRVRAISPTADISNLVAVGNVVYFTATDATNGTELWRSDGTGAGTIRVSDINLNAGSSNPTNLVNLNGILYFAANNGTNNGLYRTTAGGVELVPGTAIPAGNQIDSLTVVGSRLFFVVGTNAEPNQALWTATASGITGQVRDINLLGSDDVRSLTNVNGRLFFVASDNNPANNPNVRIWQSDGTAAGTTEVSTLDFNGAPPTNLTATSNNVFFAAEGFTASSDSVGVELFKLG